MVKENITTAAAVILFFERSLPASSVMIMTVTMMTTMMLMMFITTVIITSRWPRRYSPAVAHCTDCGLLTQSHGGHSETRSIIEYDDLHDFEWPLR